MGVGASRRFVFYSHQWCDREQLYGFRNNAGQSGTQYMCVVTNTAGTASSSAATLTVVASLPSANYVTSVNLGSCEMTSAAGWE